MYKRISNFSIFTCILMLSSNSALAIESGCYFNERTSEIVCERPPETSPLACFSINKVKVYDRLEPGNDVLNIQKGSFRLADNTVLDVLTQSVEITVDNMEFFIPAGSFTQKGEKQDFVFKSAKGSSPELSARIRADKAEWELKVKTFDVNMNTLDGLDISLNVSGNTSSENILIDSKDGIKYKYKKYPKQSCRLDVVDEDSETTPGNNKLSCISEMTVRHISGREVTKSTVDANLLHPETVFVDEATSEYAAYHTSCSKPLSCGDVIGNFVIAEISSTPGDKLSQKMGLDDASCVLP